VVSGLELGGNRKLEEGGNFPDLVADVLIALAVGLDVFLPWVDDAPHGVGDE